MACGGCKWTVGELRRYLGSSGQPDWLLWQRVCVLVSLTLLTQVGHVPHHHNCFELYGFDILVDDTLTPTLLEVNRCPSLSYDCDVDRVVKKPLLHHLFDLLGPPKVAEPLGRGLRPPVLILLARERNKKESERDAALLNHNFFTAFDLKQYSRLMENFEVFRPRKNRSSVCEDCEEGASGLRTPSTPPTAHRAFPNSYCIDNNRVANKRDSHRNPSTKVVPASGVGRCGASRRRRSISSLSGVPHDPLVPEELSLDTFVPLTFNTTFQRVRRQFVNNHHSSRGYMSLVKEGRDSQMLDIVGSSRPGSSRRGEGGRGPQRCPARCGDWVRTFPYNAATLHASKDPLYTKTLVAELHKYKRACEKVFRENPAASDDFLDALVQKMLWRDSVIWRPKT